MINAKLRISGIVQDSIVDGPGLRLSVFTQGCPHHCKGCHNPQTHDPNGGSLVKIDEIVSKITTNPLCQGLTISGGEPLMQIDPLVSLCAITQSLGKNIWLYTGYTWENLMGSVFANTSIHQLLRQVDVLVDGPFLEGKRSLSLRFCGSTNQRLIDVQKSLASENGATVLYEFD